MKSKSLLIAELSEFKSKYKNTYFKGKTDTGMTLVMTKKKKRDGSETWILETAK